jgi:glucose/arabinose dehydrogenase
MGFGPLDGYLYIATGDGGGVCDASPGHTAGTGNGQDITNNLLGKILRIDPVGPSGGQSPFLRRSANGGPYWIPSDNPFVGVLGDDEIWSYGLRNPWRCSFDAVTGDLYMGDVGQNLHEEVDYQPALTPGENYGWRCMEGPFCSSVSNCTPTGCTCDAASLADPIFTLTETAPASSVTGGYVYRGTALPALRGTYFFADFVTHRIYSFRTVNGTPGQFIEHTAKLTTSLDGHAVEDIASFGEDALGELYIVDRGTATTGEVFKIVPRP